MRKVAVCVAGTFVSFPIPDTVLREAGENLPEGVDMREPSAVLERVAACVRRGEQAAVGHDEMRAAARIWQFCNHGRDDGEGEDVVVVDYMGDGRSVEFAPLASLGCAPGRAGCVCWGAAGEARLSSGAAQGLQNAERVPA